MCEELKQGCKLTLSNIGNPSKGNLGELLIPIPWMEGSSPELTLEINKGPLPCASCNVGKGILTTTQLENGRFQGIIMCTNKETSLQNLFSMLKRR